MTGDHGKVLLSHGVRHFVDQGGTLEYELRVIDGQKCWFLYGLTETARLQVYLQRTGEPKILRNANAVLNYHESMCPDDGGVFITFSEKPKG